MAFHDRRPQIEEGVKPNELPEEEELEGEGTPSDPAENNDPDETKETPEEDAPEEIVAGSEEAEEVTEEAAASEEEPPKKLKVPLESAESLEVRKAKLLKDVEDLRLERRNLKGSPFQEQSKDPLFVKTPEEDPLKDVAPGDIDLVEKILKAKGYVKKDEIAAKDYHGNIKSYTEAWLEKNPEFKPGSEEADEAWDKLNAYATKFFNKPTDPKDVIEILDTSRERLFGKKTGTTLPTRSLHSVAAKKEKIAVSAKPSNGGSGGSRASAPSEKSTIDPKLIQHLKGFSDDELTEIAAS